MPGGGSTPVNTSTFATIGLLILAIGGLAAVSAWLWTWYQGRQPLAEGPDGTPPPDDGPDPDVPDAEPPTDPDPTSRV